MPQLSRATVEIEWCGQVYAGIAEEPASEAGKLRSAAQATTDVVGQILGDITLELLDLDTVNAFGAPAVIVALSARTKEPEYFVGFCVVADEPAVAAAKSVLSATNRFIQRIQDPI